VPVALVASDIMGRPRARLDAHANSR